MRILLLSGDVWNDSSNGNNIYSNWFDGYDAEFANIYLSQGLPENKCCTHYFQVTDRMMLRSMFGIRAGKAFDYCSTTKNTQKELPNKLIAEQENTAFYTKIKKFASEPLRLARDILWSIGRYDEKALKCFIDNFNPDIIFCTHLFSIKYRRIELIIRTLSNAPMVAFTGDAEASLKNINYNPLYWARQLNLHRLYPAHVKIFKEYFTFSQAQCDEITAKYGVPSETLYKCADIKPFKEKQPNKIIRIVYAGRLYCNRWKTIAAIGEALTILNKDGKRAEVHVYSQDNLNEEQQKALSEKKYIYFMGCTHPSNLPNIYKNADIALHVESLDKKYKYATMHSFSTKIIDLMSSSCAIMAICWDHNNGWNYLKKENAAICISNYNEILPTMQRIVRCPQLLTEYAKKASECGAKNHSRQAIQQQITNVFTRIIKEYKK